MNNPTATLLDRTKSSTIDTLLLIGVAFLIAGILNYFENVPTWVRALSFISLIMYEPICITFGATLGNHIMNIRIRRSSNDSKKLNIVRSFFRFISKFIFGWFSYVTIFKNPRKRAIHDLITGATTIQV
ncbi:RDD family protein [Flavobacterium sp. 5]|uniref:RDD family protein n=1 Tax=Flavobacterium sp. 5 TaxID=2035199 RepID=UPI000C2C2A85|nr:RDD family protein [Flavobacterium sp. 5]PKB17300.1 RDD family protein [Flavobacterium sp. 5]